jgi:hypothetical protein
VTPQATVGGLLNRANLALIGLVIALFGAGAILVTVDQADAAGVGVVIAAVAGRLLTVAGVRQMCAAARGRLPGWYAELLAGGDVFIGGPRARE